MPKIVYQTDLHGWFSGITQAFESPLEPGVHLMPAGAVEVEPPQPLSGMYPRWIGGRWRMQPRPTPGADPVAKLAEFLAANPDVAAMLNQGGV